MPSQIVPLTTAPGQTLAVSLSIDNQIVALQLAVRFSEAAGYWVLTISDHLGNVLLDSIPLITGGYPAANILGQYAYLAIGSAYVINASGTPLDSPDSTNLGTDFLLLWDDTPSF